MAFVPEDGTGLTTANSYIDLAAFEAYWADRGVDISSWTNEQKQDALVKATDYIEQNNAGHFKGCREFPSNPQALAFPRTSIYFDQQTLPTMPSQLTFATCEYAYRALTTNLSPDPSIDSSGRTVIRRREKVGPIVQDLQFTDSENYVITKPYPAADKWLRPLLMGGGQGSVIRA